jgi:hypothetical protein
MFVDPGFGVYVDTESARFHFDQLNDLKFHHTNYHRNLDEFLVQKFSPAVAAFHVPFPLDPEFANRVRRAHEFADHVFIFCSELHTFTVSQLWELDMPRVSFYLCGSMNRKFKHAKCYFWLDWFYTSSYFYTQVQRDYLNLRLHPYTVKPKTFDILLGNQRPHRDFVYNYINSQNLQHHAVMTYVRYADRSLLTNDQFIAETEGVEYYPERKYNHSVDRVRYHGVDVSLSQIVPITVYNQTAYTITAETNFNSSFNFYTEKTVKPILARRLFIGIAGQYYLHNLRELGFKTFDGIIDESYDAVLDDTTRWQMAMDQASWLATQDQVEILEKIKPIAEHNYRLMTERHWYREFLEQLTSELQTLVNNTKVGPVSGT